MKENYIIRKAIVEDAEQFVKLKNLVWRDAYKNIFPEEVFLELENQEVIDFKIDSFESYLISNINIFSYVVEVDNKIIGLMHGCHESEYDYFSNLGYAELQAIYIKPEYQHLGIGSKLFKIFKQEIKNKNLNKFVIGVLKDNFPARKCYEHWGGKLEDYTKIFTRLNKDYIEVFYTFKI